MNDKTVATIPHRTEVSVNHSFDQIKQMANSFAKSGLFGVKDPDQALSLLLYGQALGKHPAIIMRDYNLINNRLAKTAEAMLRDFQASGGRVDWKKYDDEGCIGVFTHPLSPTPITIDWDMNRAKKAGLAGKNGDMYVKYTRAMFRSRVISEGVRTTAPDATENMYTPEEIRTIEADEPPEPVSITQAVKEAAAQVTNAIPEDELDAMVMTLDVKTMAELTPAFGHAYKKAKSVGDERAMKKLKANYDDMKSAIESGQIV